MWNRFDVGASTIQKYIDFIHVVLYDKDKRLNKAHNHTFKKKHLLRIVNQFKKFIGLSNICGTIDGTRIPLVEMPSNFYLAFQLMVCEYHQ